MPITNCTRCGRMFETTEEYAAEPNRICAGCLILLPFSGGCEIRDEPPRCFGCGSLLAEVDQKIGVCRKCFTLGKEA